MYAFDHIVLHGNRCDLVQFNEGPLDFFFPP